MLVFCCIQAERLSPGEFVSKLLERSQKTKDAAVQQASESLLNHLTTSESVKHGEGIRLERG